MQKKRILVNVFSNWTNFVVLIVIAFFVSPIMVHRLGNEQYGIWTLIVSITGYFTVLDFGVNAAIVRFISKYEALKDRTKANEIYSTSFVFFLAIGLGVVAVVAVFGAFFPTLFGIESLSRKYVYIVFVVVGADLAFSLLFSVLLGTLTALQQFLRVNAIGITISVAKNLAIVSLLLNGYGLLSLALAQISANAVKYLLQYLVLRRYHGHLEFSVSACNRSTLKQIYNYSAYSFLISIALKLLFYTDSIVIGSLIAVSEVTFYAIPATLIDYLEKIVWAMIAVLVPVISSQEAVGDQTANKQLYVLGTKYSLIVCLPIVFVLFTVGSDFIGIWIGPEYGLRSDGVLKILLAGKLFALSQLVAHGILKGTSRHKVLAFILLGESAVNLTLSLTLARRFGIEGVALGTLIPLLISNLLLIPLYTCRRLGLSFPRYLVRSYFSPLLGMAILAGLYAAMPLRLGSYLQIALYSLAVVLIFGSYALFFIVDRAHRAQLLGALRHRLRP